MKTITKYKSFEELNSAEKAATDVKSSLKKHASYEVLISKIYAAKTTKQTTIKPAIPDGK